MDFADFTEEELTSNTGRTFQPGDRVTNKYGTPWTGTVQGNRYFGAGVYGVLVLINNHIDPFHCDPANMRRA